MILVKVVDKVPESLLVSVLASKVVKFHLEVPLGVQLVLDVLIETSCAHEICLLLLVPAIVGVTST